MLPPLTGTPMLVSSYYENLPPTAYTLYQHVEKKNNFKLVCDTVLFLLYTDPMLTHISHKGLFCSFDNRSSLEWLKNNIDKEFN